MALTASGGTRVPTAKACGWCRCEAPAGVRRPAPGHPGPSVSRGPHTTYYGRRHETIWAQPGRPASSTASRFGGVAQPPGTGTGTGSSPARPSRTPSRPCCSQPGAAGCCSAARPSPEAAQTSHTPASWGWSNSWPTARPWRSLPTPATKDSAPRPADVWCRHCTERQEERARLVRRVGVHERQRKAHSSRRIRVEHGIAHLKNRRALASHLGHREFMSPVVQAVAGLLSHQQSADLIRGTAELNTESRRGPRRLTPNHARPR